MWVEAAAAVPYHYYFAFWMAKTATSCTKTNAYSRDAHSIAHNVENVAKITILQYFSSKSFRWTILYHIPEASTTQFINSEL